MQDDRLLVPPSVLIQEMSDGELVLLHVTDGQYFTLNRTGSDIWQLLADGHSPYGTASAIAEQYDIDFADALVCVVQLTQKLKHSGLLIQEAA